MMLAVCRDAKFRDGQKAVGYAATACKLTDEKDFQSLEALAAAKADVGQFDEAVSAQKKALELLADLHGTPPPAAKARLKLYEARKPVRVRSFVLEWVH
jgi:hypothetical protein